MGRGVPRRQRLGDRRRQRRAEHEAQDKKDAESLYSLLEDEVVPRFFERGEDGLPHRWIETMKASIESVVPHFSAHRMVRDYVLQAYLPAAARR